MKVNVEIDCTPQEARQFFGLPDVQPMQTAVMEKLQHQMLDNIQKVSPEALMQSWLSFDPKFAERFTRHVRGDDRPRRCAHPRQKMTSSPDGGETPAGSRLRPPSLGLLLAEMRGIFELNASLMMSPLLMRAPKGDGHPVLALPGFLASDLSMAPMRRYLTELGYDAHAWQMGRNFGGLSRMRAALRERLAEIHAITGRKVSLDRLESRRRLCARPGAACAGDGALCDDARKSFCERRAGDQCDAALRGAVR